MTEGFGFKLIYLIVILSEGRFSARSGEISQTKSRS